MKATAHCGIRLRSTRYWRDREIPGSASYAAALIAAPNVREASLRSNILRGRSELISPAAATAARPPPTSMLSTCLLKSRATPTIMNSSGSLPVFSKEWTSPNWIGTASPSLIGAVSAPPRPPPTVAVPEPFIT